MDDKYICPYCFESIEQPLHEYYIEKNMTDHPQWVWVGDTAATVVLPPNSSVFMHFRCKNELMEAYKLRIDELYDGIRSE